MSLMIDIRKLGLFNQMAKEAVTPLRTTLAR